MSSYIEPISPRGTNSTMFTSCCRLAITDREPNCPGCEKPVIGHDETSDYRRGSIRWANATRLWERRSYK